MLREWAQSWSSSPALPVEAKPNSEQRGEPTVAPSRAEQRDKELRRKLQSAARPDKVSSSQAHTYDSAFRGIARVVMDGHQFSLSEGLLVNVARGVHNVLVSTKWNLGAPQTSNAEWAIQMSGFSDLTSVSYSSLKRWQLLHQRSFPNGALMVLQFASQTQMGMGTFGSFYAMAQYPIMRGGWAQLQYVKQQSVSLSIMQEVLHGMNVGSQMTYELSSNKTSVSYCLSARGPEKNLTTAAEIKPATGEWKIGMSRFEWSTDSELACMLERAESQHGKQCSFIVGMKHNHIGGGSVAFSLRNFYKLRSSVALVYGGARPGANQVQVTYDATYDALSGKYAHGLSVTC